MNDTIHRQRASFYTDRISVVSTPCLNVLTASAVCCTVQHDIHSLQQLGDFLVPTTHLHNTNRSVPIFTPSSFIHKTKTSKNQNLKTQDPTPTNKNKNKTKQLKMSSPMKSPVMKQHDPEDDPFAALSAEMDSNMLTLPTDYGTGAVDQSKEQQQQEEVTDNNNKGKITPPSSPKKDTENVTSPKDEE